MSYTKEETSTGFCVNILSYVTSIQNFRVIRLLEEELEG